MGQLSGHSVFLLLLLPTLLPAFNQSDGDRPTWNFFKSPGFHEPRIVGGTAAEENEFPYMVCLMMSGTHICGATLLAEAWVLSAAHCVVNFKIIQFWTPVYTYPPSLFEVVVGSTTCESRLKGQRLRVESVYAHPKFNINSNSYDICLLKLKTPAKISESVQLVPLPNDTVDAREGTECIAIGWGVSTPMPASYSGRYPQGEYVLQKVSLPIFSIPKCRRAFHYVTDQNICTLVPGKDACVGDSGGPLVCGDLQLGITSYGQGCADPKYPGVFQRVDTHLRWVRSVLADPSKAIPEVRTEVQAMEEQDTPSVAQPLLPTRSLLVALALVPYVGPAPGRLVQHLF